MSARITLTGNAAGDAELRFTPTGTPVANVTVAVTPRVKQPDGSWGDGETAFYRVACFGTLAENAAESIQRGTRVNVDGTLKPREYEHNGQTRLSLDVTADSIGPDLRFATAQVTKAQRQGGQQQQSGGWGAPQQSTGFDQSTGAGGWGQPSNEAPF